MKNRILLVVACIAVAISGCLSNKNKNTEPVKTIAMGYVDGWAEGVAMTHIAKEILVQEGYDVDVKKAAVDMIFASLANGDTDVFMDAWLPVTHKEKVAKFEGKIESLGVNFTNARIGLVVPAYVDINSIEELNTVKEKFDGHIIGIEKGAGITGKTELALKEYALEMDQMNSSSIGMLAELQKAIKENRWIVVAGWAPHWKFARYDLKFLDDPKAVYGATERLETYARKGFKTDDAFATNFFVNFSLTDEQMASLLNKMQEGKDKDAIAKAWVAENPELVKSWLAKK